MGGGAGVDIYVSCPDMTDGWLYRVGTGRDIATQIASFAAVDSWCNLAWAAVHGKQRGQSNIARQVNRSPSQCHELIIRFKLQDLVRGD